MLKKKKIIKVLKVFSITAKYLKMASRPKTDITIIQRQWSTEIVSLFNMKINVIGSPVSTLGPYLLVGNHISYLDIPILLYTATDISFVSKSEIKSWPVIGKAAIKGKTLFVDRANSTSRGIAKTQIAKSLIEDQKKLVIFPSGTTSIKTSSNWKKGAFEIAEKNNVLLQPFRIHYKPLRAIAYVGKDNFLVHMYRLFRFDEILATIEFHEPVSITNSQIDCSTWKKWCEL